MTFNWEWIVGPLVGAIIGLITNGIAIRMLFRPLHAIKIGNFTLPFTPGLIPKEKPRIAHSLGIVVADQLVNADVLRGGMLNPEIDKKITEFISSFLGKYKDSNETIYTLLSKHFQEEDIKYYTVLTENKIAEVVYQKAVSMNLGQMTMNAVNKEFERREREDPTSIQFLPVMVALVEQKIIELINDTVEKQGFFIITRFLNKETTQLFNIPLKTIYQKGEKYIPELQETVLKVYHYAVLNYLPTVLKEINIAKLVENRINAFSIEELEKLLLDLMRKELNAIVYLGGLLGALMGIVMIFI